MTSIILAAVLLQASAQTEVVRADHFVERGEDRLFVREVSSGSGRDFWSRPADADTLQAHLVHAPRVERLDLWESTHFVHLDRSERGRDRLLEAIVRFLAAGE